MHVVFDLDGTLANGFGRAYSHLACPERGYPYVRRDMDWDAFFQQCDLDTPYKHAIDTLRALYLYGHDVSIWTGRSASVRDKTVRWLIDHDVPRTVATQGLVMRPVGDHRDDDILKESWVKQYGRPDLVFEDRERVVKMWRSLGIPCFQVADGKF